MSSLELAVPYKPIKRNYPALVSAMSEILDVMRIDRLDVEDALRRSFFRAVDGFQSQIGLLLLVRDTNEPDTPALSAFASKGLTDEDVAAAERLAFVKGVSATMIRGALKSGALQLVENPF